MTFRFAAYVTTAYFGIILSTLTIVGGVVFLVEGKLVSMVSFLAPFTPLFNLAGGFFVAVGVLGIALIMYALFRKEKPAVTEKVRVQPEIQQ